MSADVEQQVYVVAIPTYPDDHEILGVFATADAAEGYVKDETAKGVMGCVVPEIQKWPVSKS